MAKLHCNNTQCRYYTDSMDCTAEHAYYVNRLIVRDIQEATTPRELSRTDALGRWELSS